MVTVDEVMPGVHRILLQSARACYLVRGERSALIDAGLPADAPDLLEGLERLGLGPADLELLLLTHVHADHGGGAAHLTRWSRGLTVYAHERGVRHLVDPTRLAAGVRRAYGARYDDIGVFLPLEPTAAVRPLEPGQTIDLGGVVLRALETPGHARHHVAFWEPSRACAFTGDALGSKYPGLPNLVLSPPSDYDPDLAKRSIDEIGALRPRLLCFAHSGPYAVAPECRLFEDLKQQHDDWVRTVASILQGDADVTNEEALERFLAWRPHLRTHATQRFSFGLSVAGILTHLRSRGG